MALWGTRDSFSVTGTVDVSNNTTAVAGDANTVFTTELDIGDALILNGRRRKIASVDSANTLTLADNWTGGNVTGGTAFTAVRRNRVIETASQSAVLINPTVTSVGTELDGQLIPGGTGKKAGGGGVGNLEMVLKPLTTYLFRLTNVNGTAHMAELLLEWYE